MVVERMIMRLENLLDGLESAERLAESLGANRGVIDMYGTRIKTLKRIIADSKEMIQTK